MYKVIFNYSARDLERLVNLTNKINLKNILDKNSKEKIKKIK